MERPAGSSNVLNQAILLLQLCMHTLRNTLPAAVDAEFFVQGRIFIDRDPQHFGLILNFLRDGTCVLPTDVDARRQILQEADFYQLESLRAFIMHEDLRQLQTAQDLRACIATRLEVPLFRVLLAW